MKVADPRILSVEQNGEKIQVCICEPDREFPLAADLTVQEAQDLAAKIMAAASVVSRAEYDRLEREEDEILRRAERIWRSRNPGKPFLAAVS
ncbi:hypothetical protein ABC766_00260 [Methylobacterium fujisawaense]|uniref:hypothetical protein n=1 Tax=Methylobacterium fujisawaense TaxID=107400 RepID=UPI0031F5320D